jgi:DNA-binding response OmpR family regulator
LSHEVAGKPRVLVVEDDAGIADAVVYALERDGMSAAAAGSLEAARAAVADADLAILDLGLPDGSGFTLLAEWRRKGAEPAVIVLTSRDAEIDCVASLEAGADDFVPKPFSPRALVARVRAVLRRGAAGRPLAAKEPPESPPTLVVDAGRRDVAYAGRPVDLTKIEFDILVVLASAPGRVLTRDQIVRRVWGDGYSLGDRTVDSHVKGLRRKLGEAGADASLITAVRGVGFKLREAS